MKKNVYIYRLLFIVVYSYLSFSAQSQNNLISGYVYEKKTRKPISDVYVFFKDKEINTYTNELGYFELSESFKNDTLIFSKVGYQTLIKKVDNTKENYYLVKEVSSLSEIVLQANDKSQLKSVESGQIVLNAKDIDQLPFILGEKDVLKLIQYTPGVQQSKEGQSGLLVRGGNGSMNLTLLDDVYINNTSHLGGIFSALNSDFIKSLTFSKSGFDAAHGGRLSSITTLKTLDNPEKKTEFKGSIGLLSSKLTGNIALSKKTSLLISGRRTYLELLKPLSNDDKSILGKDKNYFFYDYLVKINTIINAKSKLSAFVYNTKDAFKDRTKGKNTNLEWSNFLTGLEFNYNFSDYFRSKSLISTSVYDFSLKDFQFPYTYSFKNSLNILSLKQQFFINADRYFLKFGLEYNINNTLPKRVDAKLLETPLFVDNQFDFNYDDVSLFADVKFDISESLKVKSGLRITSFITKSNGLIDRELFYSLEPRLSLNYNFTENQSFKLSYHKVNQFLHQASVASFSLPLDFYLVSTNNIKPQVNNQISLGYVFEKNFFKLNAETYYRRVKNYTEFQNGALNNLFNSNIYEDIVVGRLDSYGVEIGMSARWNKISGQFSGTLSSSTAKFDEINNGKYFRTTFGRPVNLNTIINYSIHPRVELGALFTFTSGQNFTPPSDIRIIDENAIINFGAKNSASYPNYHRLDFSCTYTFKTKGKWKSKLNLTIYNVYNNDNTFLISYDVSEDLKDSSQITITQESESLFPILPTLNWLFSF